MGGCSKVLAGIATALACLDARAAEPVNWEMGFQPAATPVMRDLELFHDWLLIVITVISLVVLGLLIYVMARFNERRNPSPSRTTHNTLIEVIWTVVPIMILVGIAIYSFKLLYFEGEIPKADLTIKAIGHQWYWSYQYPDSGISIDAALVDDQHLKPGQLRLLTTEDHLRVPVGATVRVQTTSTDVIHSWAVPSFGVKEDAVPGRLNETWFKVDAPGIYYGQCSELCGTNHGFMPIMVEAMPKQAFDDWVTQNKPKTTGQGPGTATGAPATQVATAPSN